MPKAKEIEPQNLPKITRAILGMIEMGFCTMDIATHITRAKGATETEAEYRKRVTASRLQVVAVQRAGDMTTVGMARQFNMPLGIDALLAVPVRCPTCRIMLASVPCLACRIRKNQRS